MAHFVIFFLMFLAAYSIGVFITSYDKSVCAFTNKIGIFALIIVLSDGLVEIYKEKGSSSLSRDKPSISNEQLESILDFIKNDN